MIYPMDYALMYLLNDVIFIGSMSLFLSIIATIYPSIRATKIEPATALKYE